MTNKPMLSVERGLLAEICDDFEAGSHFKACAGTAKLRALLDGPEVATSEIKLTGEYHTDVQALMLQVIKLQLVAVDKPAAQHTIRSVMDAVQQARDFPVLTSNQCHALAEALNGG